MSDWGALSWPAVADAVRERPLALLPFGAIEEHGPHLPLDTDVVLADALAERIAAASGLLRLPTIPLGQVWSLARFPGSLSVSDHTLVSIVADLAPGLARNGVRGLVLLTAHLGNVAALHAASRLLSERELLPALVVAYPGLREAGAEVREAPESHPSIMHADELETSMMLAVAPERVDMDRAVAEYPVYPPHFGSAPIRWDALDRSGVFGDATASTAEKGERLLELITAAAGEMIDSWREEVLG
jgi:creatinine amidohydrolase